VPGIQPADVEELLDHGSKVIVLSRGMHLALRPPPRLANYSGSVMCTITSRKPRRPWNFIIAWQRRASMWAGYSTSPADRSLPPRRACNL
jgi:hypothetical protein